MKAPPIADATDATRRIPTADAASAAPASCMTCLRIRVPACGAIPARGDSDRQHRSLDVGALAPDRRAAACGRLSPMADQQQRAELAEFLRARREAVTPEQVKLPAGRGRRTPGLRREEVALLAGVSVTWYTWLEQGRRINASTDVLRAIGRALRLDDAGQDHLVVARPADGADGAGAGARPTRCRRRCAG